MQHYTYLYTSNSTQHVIKLSVVHNYAGKSDMLLTCASIILFMVTSVLNKPKIAHDHLIEKCTYIIISLSI